jgi:nucleoside-diphosphate-sugar epimerase
VRILVTGGAGYVGSHLVNLLVDSGHEVVVLDSLDYGREGLGSFAERGGIRFVQGDICNIRDLIRAMDGSEVVIALAAIVGDRACELDYEDTLATNYESTKLLVEAAVHDRVSRIVFASSCSVYGAASNLTLNEGSWLNPQSLYARTRIMSEDVLVANRSRVDSTILRLGTVFGWSARMRFDLVANIMTADAVYTGRILVNGGGQCRPLVHCRDAARAFQMVAEAQPAQASMQIFNVGDDSLNLTVLEIAQRIAPLVPGCRIELRDLDGDRRDYRVSFQKANHVLGFRSTVTLEEGVREMIDRLRATPLDYTSDVYYNVKYRR